MRIFIVIIFVFAFIIAIFFATISYRKDKKKKVHFSDIVRRRDIDENENITEKFVKIKYNRKNSWI